MKKVVLFLHGYGANGDDLIGLKNHINNPEEDIIFLSPNAPETCPVNFFGYQWFDLVERTPEEIYLGLKKSYHYLDQIISNITIKYEIESEDIVIVGFSQGAMLASYYGLINNNKLNGIISLSGALPKKILNQINKPNLNQKFFIYHGSEDSIVPSQRSEDLHDYLASMSIENNLIIEKGCDHGISAKALQEIKIKIAIWLS